MKARMVALGAVLFCIVGAGCARQAEVVSASPLARTPEQRAEGFPTRVELREIITP